MKTATIKELKDELGHYSREELLDYCLRMAKFKKENKELLTYLLFEASNEAHYIEGLKELIDERFSEINTSNYYYIKKSIRKILREIKKHLRYSKNKETAVELLIYFCQKLALMRPSMNRSIALQNIYQRQLILIRKTIKTLDEDLQYDYGVELDNLP
tara:strand:+ start:419 stop:892 length:474 start_codon:yes stop_codon:yes gene_type:complete